MGAVTVGDFVFFAFCRALRRFCSKARLRFTACSLPLRGAIQRTIKFQSYPSDCLEAPYIGKVSLSVRKEFVLRRSSANLPPARDSLQRRDPAAQVGLHVLGQILGFHYDRVVKESLFASLERPPKNEDEGAMERKGQNL